MNHITEDFEAIRRSYKSETIVTLFVGESAPAGGTFFYKGGSQMYRYMKQSFGDPPNFLNFLKDRGLDTIHMHRYPAWESLSHGELQLSRRSEKCWSRCG